MRYESLSLIAPQLSIHVIRLFEPGLNLASPAPELNTESCCNSDNSGCPLSAEKSATLLDGTFKWSAIEVRVTIRSCPVISWRFPLNNTVAMMACVPGEH